MGKGYGQFCPIAKAAEVICDRWTPLVLRELMNGSRCFNELAAGVPLMSRSLLTQRLRVLEDKNVIVSTTKSGGRGREYLLTPAGDAIRPIIDNAAATPPGPAKQRRRPRGLTHAVRTSAFAQHPRRRHGSTPRFLQLTAVAPPALPMQPARCSGSA
jgi:DNA-binding HxlR family transcriptional regulator